MQGKMDRRFKEFETEDYAEQARLRDVERSQARKAKVSFFREAVQPARKPR